MADKLPQQIVDEEATKENLADRAAMNKYVVEPIKALGKKAYENVMGTKEQNDAAQARLDKAPTKKAKGGKVSSASKRADGIAQRGKTKGRYL